ncbi:MAG: MBL fold metallo-hydrolase [Clostridia bacterium]|nr:MBL fold metallo-hydrolase [Clostridia bacterium]
MFRIKKHIAVLTACVLAVITLCACTSGTKTETTATPSANTEVPSVNGEYKTTVLKTGKSDAIILETTGGTMVIDCGEENDGDEVVEYLKANGITKVDYLVITHFDQDHVGGAAEVISNFSIGEIITPDYAGSNSEYTNFITAASNANYSITRLTESKTVTLGDVLFEIYPPLKSSYSESDNDYSIVVKATHGSDTFLYAGDAETERLKELYSQIDLDVDFLKVPHHGRIDTESANFIKAVSPKYAVVTCSKKEGADEELISLLSAANAATYLNRDGTITAVSTGSGITVTQAAADTSAE